VAFLQDYGISLPPQICDVRERIGRSSMPMGDLAGSFGISMAQLANVLARDCEIQSHRVSRPFMAVTTILIIASKNRPISIRYRLREIGGSAPFIAVALPFVLKHPALAHDNGKCFCRPNAGRSGSSAGPVWREGPAWYFSPTSGSTLFPPKLRKPRSRRRTCPSAFLLARGLPRSLHRGFRIIDATVHYSVEYRRSRVAGHS